MILAIIHKLEGNTPRHRKPLLFPRLSKPPPADPDHTNLQSLLTSLLNLTRYVSEGVCWESSKYVSEGVCWESSKYVSEGVCWESSRYVSEGVCWESVSS